jgi:uncharacterized membrane protein YeaQ/YmgE (transglycosylase-associated protein family)
VFGALWGMITAVPVETDAAKGVFAYNTLTGLLGTFLACNLIDWRFKGNRSKHDD